MPYAPTNAGPGDLRELYYWVHGELRLIATEFGTVTGVGGNVPAGGAAGQALIKNSGADGDYSWGSISVSWASISGKPSVFTPEAHTHLIENVTGLQTALDGKATAAQGALADSALQPGANVSELANDAGYLTSVSWSIITGIPSTFPPDSHSHAISDVTNLQTTLDGKANLVHSHVIADVSGLQTALDGKANSSHSHTKSDITDFSDGDYATAVQGLIAENALQPGYGVSLLSNDAGYLTSVSWGDIPDSPSTFPPSAHTHTVAEIQNLTGLLNGKADTFHTHSIAQVTGLQIALDAKSNVGHSHVKADITDFDDADYATAAQGALADTALQPGDVVSVEPENICFHRLFGGRARATRGRIQRLIGGNAAAAGSIRLCGGDASTLFLTGPVALHGGAAA